jgi:exoribonuclease R
MRVIGQLVVNFFFFFINFSNLVIFIQYHRLIEEFMLLANMLVADHLRTVFPKTALLRNHQPPDSVQIEKIAKSLKVYDINIDFTSAGSIQKSKALYTQGGKPDDFLRDIIINNILSKPMVVSINNSTFFNLLNYPS